MHGKLPEFFKKRSLRGFFRYALYGGVIIGIIVFILFLYSLIPKSIISPLPDESGIKLILITPSPSIRQESKKFSIQKPHMHGIMSCMGNLTASQLRTFTGSLEQFQAKKRNSIVLVLDNVLDTYNVGAIFRLADALAVSEVILAGGTLTPPNTRIKKASINTTEWVPWRYFDTARLAIETLKQENAATRVFAVEQHPKSVPYQSAVYTQPLVLVVGNETTGVLPETLSVVDHIVELPMWGVNTSLNVMVSCGIVLYEIMRQRKVSEV